MCMNGTHSMVPNFEGVICLALPLICLCIMYGYIEPTSSNCFTESLNSFL